MIVKVVMVEHGVLGQGKWIHGSSNHKLELLLEGSVLIGKAFVVAYSYC